MALRGDGSRKATPEFDPPIVQAPTSPSCNRLLAHLEADSLRGVAFDLEHVDCPTGMILCQPDVGIEHVYFLCDGAASIVAASSNGKTSEVALFGREGYVVPAVGLGADSIPHRCEVQLPGSAYRMHRRTLLDLMGRDASFHDRLLTFAHVTAIQITFTSLSNAVDQIPVRLARWLLMYHDRSHSDDLALTHGTLSQMLGVRRPSVTTALHELEGHRLVRNDSGYITIVDRRGLRAFTNGAYGKPEDAYRRLVDRQDG